MQPFHQKGLVSTVYFLFVYLSVFTDKIECVEGDGGWRKDAHSEERQLCQRTHKQPVERLTRGETGPLPAASTNRSPTPVRYLASRLPGAAG